MLDIITDARELTDWSEAEQSERRPGFALDGNFVGPDVPGRVNELQGLHHIYHPSQ